MLQPPLYICTGLLAPLLQKAFILLGDPRICHAICEVNVKTTVLWKQGRLPWHLNALCT